MSVGLIKPDLNKPVFKLMPDKAKLIRQGKCPSCKRPIWPQAFTDDLSKKEYSISGLCQTCQNSIFNHKVIADEYVHDLCDSAIINDPNC